MNDSALRAPSGSVDRVSSEPDQPLDVAPANTADGQVDAQGESQVDLTAIEHDLSGVEHALQRLDDGTYWTDEVTGDSIGDAVLAADPVARRNP